MRSLQPVLHGLPVLVALVLVGEAAAQNPYADYNRDRAYRHFLNSTAPIRTIYSSRPGYTRSYSTPYEYAEWWQGPGYVRERIGPTGHERFEMKPERGGYVVRRPVIVTPPPVYAVPRPYGYAYPPPYRYAPAPAPRPAPPPVQTPMPDDELLPVP